MRMWTRRSSSGLWHGLDAETGAGSVLSLALLGGIMCSAAVLLPVVGVYVVHNRAQSASDQSALAAADALNGVTWGVPCAVAQSIFDTVASSEWTCQTVGDDAYVSGTVTYGPISFDVKSRAGPPQD